MDIVTACVSMLLEKLIVAKLVKKFLVFSGTRFLSVMTGALYWTAWEPP
jgi:hypothetical protein